MPGTTPGIFVEQNVQDAVLTGVTKKNPDLRVGGPNQKPLTIKPYPMKIHRQYR